MNALAKKESKTTRLDINDPKTQELLRKVCLLQNELRQAILEKNASPADVKLYPGIYKDFMGHKKALVHGQPLEKCTKALGRDDIFKKISALLQPIGFAQFARNANLTNVPTQALEVFFVLRTHKVRNAKKVVVPTYAKQFGDAAEAVSGALMLNPLSIMQLIEEKMFLLLQKVLGKELLPQSLLIPPPIPKPETKPKKVEVVPKVPKAKDESKPKVVESPQQARVELPQKITIELLEKIEGDFRQKDIDDTKLMIEMVIARLAMLMKTKDEKMKGLAREQLGGSFTVLRQTIKFAAMNVDLKDLLKLITQEEAAIAQVLGH